MTTAKKTSGLGTNPLATVPKPQGIFQKTTESRNQIPESGKQKASKLDTDGVEAKAKKQKPDSIKKKPEPGFLAEGQDLDKVTLRIPIELNDWLDDLRKHGQKIPKEIWVQAALEFFKSVPIDWSEIQSVEQMREKLQILENGNQNTDS
jgi:predicted RNase H-like HicB family nuclease